MLNKATIAVLLLLAVLAVSCGAARQETPQPAGQEFFAAPQDWQAQLPPLPAVREASGTNVSERVGSNYFAKSSNAVEDGNNLKLLSGGNSLAWAYWQYIDIRPELAQNSEPIVSMLDGRPAVLFYDKVTDMYRMLKSSTQYG